MAMASSIDYEVTDAYTLVLEIIDAGKVPPLTGQATVKVRNRSMYFTPWYQWRL